MAISAGIPGLEVTIEVAGKILKEFDFETPTSSVTTPSPDPPTNTTTKHLEAPSGTEFSIRYTFNEPFTPTFPIHMDVTLDGQIILEPHADIDPKDGRESWVCSSTAYTVDEQAYTQNFRFSELTIEEDNRAVSEELKQQLAPVGKITLAFWYVEETRAVRPEELPQQRLEEFGTVSEKALKKWCLTHHAGLHTPQQKNDLYYSNVKTVGDHPSRLSSLSTALRALKNLHVIPRTPPPSPLLPAERRDPATMSREEMLEFYQEMVDTLETERRVNREREETISAAGSGSGARDYEAMEYLGTQPAKRLRRNPSEGEEVVDLGE